MYRTTEQIGGRPWPANAAIVSALGPVPRYDPREHPGVPAHPVFHTRASIRDARAAILEKYPAEVAYGLEEQADAALEAGNRVAAARLTADAERLRAEAAALRSTSEATLEEARAQQHQFLEKAIRRSVRDEELMRERLLDRADALMAYGRPTESREIRSSIARSQASGDAGTTRRRRV